MTSKHQVTIPTEAFDAAGLQTGDVLVVRSDGPGRVVMERQSDVIAELAGSMPGVWGPGYLDQLRDEWE